MADPNVTACTGFGLVAIMAHRHVDPDQIGAVLDIAMPAGPTRAANRDGVSLTGTGPGCWLAHVPAEPAFWADTLRDRLAGLASISDQSSAYALLRLTGPHAGRLLQRGMAIDLHPGRFGPGSVAPTAIAHIGVIVWQVDDRPTYEIAIPRSYEPAFRDWLEHSAAAL